VNRARPLAVSLPDAGSLRRPRPSARLSDSEVRRNHESIIDIFDVSMVTAGTAPALLYRALLCLFQNPAARAARLMADQASHL